MNFLNAGNYEIIWLNENMFNTISLEKKKKIKALDVKNLITYLKNLFFIFYYLMN